MNTFVTLNLSSSTVQPQQHGILSARCRWTEKSSFPVIHTPHQINRLQLRQDICVDNYCRIDKRSLLVHNASHSEPVPRLPCRRDGFHGKLEEKTHDRPVVSHNVSLAQFLRFAALNDVIRRLLTFNHVWPGFFRRSIIGLVLFYCFLYTHAYLELEISARCDSAVFTTTRSHH